MTKYLSLNKAVLFVLMISIIGFISCHNQIDDYYAIISFGMPIVDGIFNYESDPRSADEIKNSLTPQIDEEKSAELYSRIFSSDYIYKTLGGSSMNMIRTSNHILQVLSRDNTNSHKVAYIGSTGKDTNGEYIKTVLNSEGITFLNEEFEEERTSTTIVLIQLRERYMYTDFGGSKKISLKFFEDHLEMLKQSKIFLADAYLIGEKFDCYKLIYSTLSQGETYTSLSLASEYIVKDHFDKINEIVPYLDFIFFNKQELRMWKKMYNMGDLSAEEFFNYIANRGKANKDKNLVIVNTNGRQDTILFVMDYKSGESRTYYVPTIQIDEKLIIDLNGAGDSFTGAFLAAYYKGNDYIECVRIGNRVASKVIKYKGFQVPKEVTHEFIFPPNEDL